EVVAGVVLGRGAGEGDPAVGQHQLGAEDVVDGDAVLQRVRPAGVGGDVAADGAGALAGRVGGEVVAVRLDVVGEPEVDHARLDDGVAVAVIDLQNASHARQGDQHAAADGQAAAREAGAGAAGQEGDVQLVAGAHHLHHLLGAGGEDDHLGPVLL